MIGDNIGSGEIVNSLVANQLADGFGVTVNEGASFDLAGVAETIGTLAIQGGTVTTGAGTLTIASGGSIITIASSQTATIGGHLTFGGPNNFFTVAQGMTASGVDLDVSAVISSGNNIIKAGAGTLAFSAANTYSGGTNINSGVLAINHDTGAGTGVVNILGTGTLDVSGGITANNALNVSSSGIAIRSSGGGNALGGTVNLGTDATIDVSGGSALTVAGTIDDSSNWYGLSKIGTGTLILSAANSYTGATAAAAGFLRAANDNAFGDPAATATVAVYAGSTLELAGGITLPSTKTIAISGVPVADTSKIMSVTGNNTIQGNIGITGGNNVSFDVASGTSLTIAGVISGSRDFDKNNTGTLILSGTNTNTGNVNVGDGTLLVNGSLVTVNSVFVDGVLGGSGTVPPVTISSIGTLAPGNSPGILSSGNVTFDTGSTYSAELNGATVGTQYDQLNVTGTVTLSAPTLSISLGFSPATGEVFTIINNDGSDAVIGTFNGLAEASIITIGNQQFRVSYVGGTGNDVTLTALLRIDTWTGNGGNSNWSTGANWASGFAPIAGDQLIFPVSASQTTNVNNITAGTSFDSIIINASGYSFSGNAIQLDHGFTTSYSSGTSTFALAPTLTASQSIDVTTGGTFTLSRVISGAFGLTKLSGGTLNVSALSSFSGGTTVNAGTLNLMTSTTLLGSGSVTVTSGATLGFTGSASHPNSLTIGGTGVGGNGALRTYGNSSSDVLTGSMTLTSDLLINVASQSQFALNGEISGAFSIATTCGGTISMAGSASNSFGGTFTQNNTFVVVAKTGGALAIPGDLIVQSGTFLTQRDEQIADTGTLTVYSGAEFDLLNANEKIGAMVFHGGTITSNSSVLKLRNGGTITTYAASSTANLLGTLDLDGSLSTITVALGNPANGKDLSITAVIQNGSITKAGAGTLSLSGTSTYSGGTTINAGIVTISTNASLGTGIVHINRNIDLTNNLLIGNDFTINSAGTALKNTGLTTFQGTISLLANTVIGTSVFSNLYLNGVISGAGFGLTVNGTGTLGLGQANTYGGGTTVNGGYLQVFNTRSTGTTGTVALASGVTLVQSATLYDFPSGGLSMAGSSTFLVPLASSDTVTGTILLTGSPTFDIASGGSLSVTGVIGDGGNTFGFTKTSADKLVLAAISTYAGVTTVSGGTLQVDGSIASNSGMVIAAAGTLMGTGVVPGVTINSGGTVAPGDSPGVLRSGNVSFASGSTFNVELNGTTVGSLYDQLDVTGTANLGGATLAASLGYVPAGGDQLRIINNDGNDPITGTFNGLAEGASLTLSGHRFSISYVGGSGNDVVLTASYTTTTALASNAVTTTYGDQVIFTSLVSAVGATPTGIVSFFEGETLLGTGALNGLGIATYSTTILSASGSPHSVTAIYAGAGLFQGSTSSAYTQNVNKATLTVTADGQARAYGDANPTLTASYTGFKNGETLATSGVAGFAALATTATPSSPVAVSPFVITTAAGSLASDNYNFTYVNGLLTVTKATLTVTADNQLRTYGDANPTLTASYTGFKNGETLATSDVTGAPVLASAADATSPVSGSPFTITAAAGSLASGNYNFTYVNGLLAVTKATLVVTADDATRLYGLANPTFTSTFSGFKNGQTLANSGVTGSPDLSSTAIPSSSVVGSPYVITAALGTLAAANYDFSSMDGQLSVTQAGTSIGVVSVPASSVFGQSVIFTATVSSTTTGTPTGMVSFFEEATFLGTASLASGTAGLTISSLGVGSHYITMSFSGDSNFTSSLSTPTLFLVTPASTLTSTSALINPSVYGQPTTFTVTVAPIAPGSGLPTGSVVFFDGSTNLASVLLSAGSASLSTASLSAGSHVITVAYAGDAQFQASTSAALVQGVNRASTTVLLIGPVGSLVYGQSASFTASVTTSSPGTGIPDGLVGFYEGATLLSLANLTDGIANFSTSGLPVGTTAMTAVYLGSANFVTSISPSVSPTVAKASTSSLVVSSGATQVGQNVTFTATASAVAPGAGTPTGSVLFFDGSSLLGTSSFISGIATFSTSSLSVGAHSITANYAGDSNFVASVSPAISQTVSISGVSLTLGSSVNPTKFGQGTTFTLTAVPVSPATATPTGTVQFFDGSTLLQRIMLA